MLGADVLDLKGLLAICFSEDDMRLRAVPPALAVRLPQYYVLEEDDGVETRSWIQQEETANYRKATWGDEVLDLRECCADGCLNYEEAVYRVRGVVQYVNKGNVLSAAVASDGHFVAYFREGSMWYFVDDLDPAARVRELGGPPSAYPYLCFLERVG